MKPIRTWIVVADGAHARFYLHQGIGKGLQAAMDHDMVQELLPNREIVSDRPGRSVDPGGISRHAFAPTVDYHQFEKARFAHLVAAALNKATDQNAFDRLVLIAPPKTLGDLRQELAKKTLDTIHAEIAKDLIQATTKDLETHLGEVMAV